jgi:hypothetical protein
MVPSAQQFMEATAPVVAAYQSGDAAAAADGFMQGALENPDYRATIDPVLPAGWFEQAVATADAFFPVELPSVGEWAFNEELARRITQPVLAVLGAESGPLFREGHELVRAGCRRRPSSCQGRPTLQMENPRGLAEALTGFLPIACRDGLSRPTRPRRWMRSALPQASTRSHRGGRTR